MTQRFSFTKTAIERIVPGAKRVTYHDAKVPGLVVLVSPSGGKVFYVYRRIKGMPEYIKLGAFPAMTVEQARVKAAEVNGAIAGGSNPAELKRAVKAEPTFAEVFERFLKDKRNRSGQPLSARTVGEYRKVVNTHMAGLRSQKLSEITRDRVKMLVGRVKSPSQSNKVKAVVSSVLNWAGSENITRGDNPANGLRTKLVPARERFLLPSEMPRFFAAVEASPLRDFFLLALLTGARRSNLQAMRWQDVSLVEATWTIPKTKNGSAVTIALAPEAVEILVARKEQSVLNVVWVFPGVGKAGHLVEPKSAWHSILKAADLENLRIHDLRRTLGSWQARSGSSLPVIGKSLGHKSQQATAIYARLDLDPVRASVEQAASAMREAGRMGGSTVVRLPKATRA